MLTELASGGHADAPARSAGVQTGAQILDAPLTRRIIEIAQTRVRYGYQRIHILLRREGWPINRKRVHRLYKLAGPRLTLKTASPAQGRGGSIGSTNTTAPNQSWSMDFARCTSMDAVSAR